MSVLDKFLDAMKMNDDEGFGEDYLDDDYDDYDDYEEERPKKRILSRNTSREDFDEPEPAEDYDEPEESFGPVGSPLEEEEDGPGSSAGGELEELEETEAAPEPEPELSEPAPSPGPGGPIGDPVEGSAGPIG